MKELMFFLLLLTCLRSRKMASVAACLNPCDQILPRYVVRPILGGRRKDKCAGTFAKNLQTNRPDPDREER